MDTTSYGLYSLCAASYLGAMLASNKALQWVSYPTQVSATFGVVFSSQCLAYTDWTNDDQVLGKSAMSIPVMVMGVLFAHKRYPIAKYFCILLISAGVVLFIYKDSKQTDKGLDTDHSFGISEMLLVCGLTDY